MFPSKSYLEMKTGSSKVKKTARSKSSQTNNANQLTAYESNWDQFAANSLGSRQSAPNTPENKQANFASQLGKFEYSNRQSLYAGMSSKQSAPNTPENKQSSFAGAMNDVLLQLAQNRANDETSAQPSAQPVGSFLQQLGNSFNFGNQRNPRKKQRSLPYDKYFMGIR